MDVLHFAATKTACVYTLGSPAKNDGTEVWILLHGYAQKGDVFLQSFSGLLHSHILLIAPEALNKFYTKGGYGEVVASWMTRDNRENEIDNYVQYLSGVVTHFKEKGFQRFNLLGFSQGVATASRFLSHTDHSFAKVVLYAGEIPAEADYNQLSNYTSLYYICGDKDPFFDFSMMKKRYEHFHHMKFIPFAGGHSIDEEVLVPLFQSN